MLSPPDHNVVQHTRCVKASFFGHAAFFEVADFVCILLSYERPHRLGGVPVADREAISGGKLQYRSCGCAATSKTALSCGFLAIANANPES